MPKAVLEWAGDELGALQAAVKGQDDGQAAVTPGWDGFRRAGPAGLMLSQAGSTSGSSGQRKRLNPDAMDAADGGAASSAGWDSEALPAASGGSFERYSPPASASHWQLGPPLAAAAASNLSQLPVAAASEKEAKQRRLEKLKAQLQKLTDAAGSNSAPPLDAPMAAQQEDQPLKPRLPDPVEPQQNPAEGNSFPASYPVDSSSVVPLDAPVAVHQEDQLPMTHLPALPDPGQPQQPPAEHSSLPASFPVDSLGMEVCSLDPSEGWELYPAQRPWEPLAAEGAHRGPHSSVSRETSPPPSPMDVDAESAPLMHF